MKSSRLYPAIVAGLVFLPSAATAQADRPQLHINPRWKECSFQLDPSLTQQAWHQFASEAGLVVYFRPLASARPMGAGNWEVSALQWQTGINDTDAAWNDTFVHPDSTHWLFEGNGLQFPGLMLRRGLTDRIDVGAYATKNFNANYGFFGGQLQYSFLRDLKSDWAASARLSFVSLFGPSDLNFAVYGVDLLASRPLYSGRWVTVSPYAGVSSYLATAHEKSAVVDLAGENVLGGQAMIGAAVQISAARIGLEYNFSRVSSRSLKIGFGF